MADRDIEAISHLVALKEGWSEDRRQRTVAAYEDFLGRSGRGRFERPTLDVDALWHCHILNTTSYARYCRQRFGRYVHHLACVKPELADELRARLGGTLPDFMMTTDGLPGKGDCGASEPAPDIPDLELADCGSKKKTKKKKKKKTVKKRAAEQRLADCGTSKKGPRPVPPRPGMSLADCGLPEQPPEGRVSLADCGGAQRELPRPAPLPPRPGIAASA